MRRLRAAYRCRRIRAASGFTLIELLTVMAIILILAGLILAIAGNANYKGAQSRAQGEIQAMSTALESYKTDNGAYPSSTPTNQLSPAAVPPPDPGASGNNLYITAGETLYQALAGVTSSGGTTDANGNPLKSYFNFNVNQLNSTAGALTTPPVTPQYQMTTYVVDPFGFPYGYSTDYATAIQAANSASPTPDPAPSPAPGYNPTFDLWSTAGYSATSGKAYPTNITAANYNTLWVKNW
jgi:prepilin-type N-terminal cleavage/methylation domain-containing protein